MEYYFYMAGSLAIMLLVTKLVFCEVEGHNAKKKGIISWYNKFNESFKYQRTRNIVVMCIVCYSVASIREFFSMEWFIELIGIIAVGIIVDGLGQVIAYYYNRIRFKKDINDAMMLKSEIKESLDGEITSGIIEESEQVYDSKENVKKYLNDEDHVAFVSIDGGEFVDSFETLPPLTYVVDARNEDASSKLAYKNVKVTQFTNNAKLPFKDERMDVVVNELANYDKYELYRIVKPGGYIIIDQLGSDNYKELLANVIPFKIKGRWDKESSSRTLSDIGLDIIEGFEEVGYLRFTSLSSFIVFMKKVTRSDVAHEKFMNFYGQVLKEIKKKNYFELTTHRFMIVAKKRELSD